MNLLGRGILDVARGVGLVLRGALLRRGLKELALLVNFSELCNGFLEIAETLILKPHVVCKLLTVGELVLNARAPNRLNVHALPNACKFGLVGTDLLHNCTVNNLLLTTNNSKC